VKVLYPLRIANFFALAGQAVVERTVVAGLGGRGASLRLVACGDPEEQRRLASWAASLDVAGTVEAVPLDRADPTEEIAAADWLLLHSLPLGECRHWLAQGRVVGRLPTLQYVHSLLLAPFEIAMWSDLWRGWDGTPPARLVAPSHGAAARVRMLRRLAEARGSRLPDVAVIPHGVDLARIRSGRRDVGRRLLGIDPSDLVMLSIGRISPEKAAYHELLLAFEAATTDRGGAPATLVVAGAVAGVDRPYRRSLEALSARLGIDRRVHFVEALDEHDKPDVLAAADVFVSPAVNPQESFGLAVLEAMAAGLPVVLTRLPVFAEYVRFGVDALAVSPGDDEGLADALDTVAHDDGVREKLRHSGPEVAARFSWDTTALQHVTLYDELEVT
jgi:glycosyltransferase involved in cell wall biosynthesis